jgi:hypothetical protein
MKLGRVKKTSPKRAKVNKSSPKRASPKPSKKVNKISPKRVKKISPKRAKKVSPSPVKKVNKVFKPRHVPHFPICLKFRVEWYDESTNSYDGHVNTSLLKNEVKQEFVNTIQNTFINSLKYVYLGPSETISDINITFEPSSYIKMKGSLRYNPNIKRYEMTFGDSVKAINRKNIDQYEYSGSWAVFDGERYYKLDSVEVC